MAQKKGKTHSIDKDIKQPTDKVTAQAPDDSSLSLLDRVRRENEELMGGGRGRKRIICRLACTLR